MVEIKPNPFVPSFGVPPPVLTGRDDFLQDMSRILDGALYGKASTSVVVGARGIGKSVLLRVVERHAQQRSWRVLSVTPSSRGLSAELTTGAEMLRDSITASQSRGPRLSGITILGVGATLEAAPGIQADSDPDLRRLLTEISEHLREEGTALIITIDELQSAKPEEVRDFAKIFQHLRGCRLPVAFLGAGLPELRDTILSGREATFLQRCKIYEIGDLSQRDTRRALGNPFASAGVSVASADLDRMVQASRGYPYMVQLVGASVWDAISHPDKVASEEVDEGISVARSEIGGELYAALWNAMSPLDKRLAVALLHYPDGVSSSQLRASWGGSEKSFGTYRKRLIRHGLARQVERGLIDFDNPDAREFAMAMAEKEGWHLTSEGTPIIPAAPSHGDVDPIAHLRAESH